MGKETTQGRLFGEKILRTEYSKDFELLCDERMKSAFGVYSREGHKYPSAVEYHELRKDRLVQSYFKYGAVAVNYANQLIDALGSFERCLVKYESTKNTEYLVDAGNYLMFESMYPTLANARCNQIEADVISYWSDRGNSLTAIRGMVTRYKESANIAYLAHAANYVIYEFLNPSLDGAKFSPTNETESAGIVGVSEVEMKEMAMEA